VALGIKRPLHHGQTSWSIGRLAYLNFIFAPSMANICQVPPKESSAPSIGFSGPGGPGYYLAGVVSVLDAGTQRSSGWRTMSLAFPN
jgi:hypothetical protein